MARTLSEAYKGLLSRDWDTLLKILEIRENRALVCNDKSGEHMADMMDFLNRGDSHRSLEFLETNCIGWIPAPGDNPKDMQEYSPGLYWSIVKSPVHPSPDILPKAMEYMDDLAETFSKSAESGESKQL